MNPVTKAIECAGGLNALSARIDRSPQVISNWRTRGVPIEACPAIELATSGAVTRRDLRPDDWHLIWPELVTDEFPAPDEKKVA